MFCIAESTLLCLVQQGPPLACNIPFYHSGSAAIPAPIHPNWSRPFHACLCSISSSLKKRKIRYGPKLRFSKIGPVHAVKRHSTTLNGAERRRMTFEEQKYTEKSFEKQLVNT